MADIFHIDITVSPDQSKPGGIDWHVSPKLIIHPEIGAEIRRCVDPTQWGDLFSLDQLRACLQSAIGDGIIAGKVGLWEPNQEADYPGWWVIN